MSHPLNATDPFGVGDGVSAGLGAGARRGAGLFVGEWAGSVEHVVAELSEALAGLDRAVLGAADELRGVVYDPLHIVAVRFLRGRGGGDWRVVVELARFNSS